MHVHGERERERERGSTTGLGTRGMYHVEDPVLPSRDVNRSRINPIARGPLTTSTSADDYSEAEPLGGFLHQASPDAVNRGGVHLGRKSPDSV